MVTASGTKAPVLGIACMLLGAAPFGCNKASGLAAAMSPGEWAVEAAVGETYNVIEERGFVAVADDPRSTFSVDVDTAAYANTRRFLAHGELPPVDAVRIEELINYFTYAYPEPRDEYPFSVSAEIGECPWNADHRLVHLGIQGRHIAQTAIPVRNLVFLVDVSGSMSAPDKLPLLTYGLGLLADELRDQDRVSIVVYAGSSGLVLPPTNAKHAVREALGTLHAGGNTAGAEGLALAYEVAQRNFVAGAVNRVILASDGDFNVGPSSQRELVEMIEEHRNSGVFLSVLGFGTGNLNDAMMEQIADRGNGSYAYIDSPAEAHRVLVEQSAATLVPIAKDVKLQVEFNPAVVAGYRLVGYENRRLAHADFDDDAKDAGEIGAGHTVTALYEIVPLGVSSAARFERPAYERTQTRAARVEPRAASETLDLKIRYKEPSGEESRLLESAVDLPAKPLRQTSDDFRFSAAVAAFGMLLRNSDYRGAATFASVRELAAGALGPDPGGDRREFVAMVERAADLASRAR